MSGSTNARGNGAAEGEGGCEPAVMYGASPSNTIEFSARKEENKAAMLAMMNWRRAIASAKANKDVLYDAFIKEVKVRS